MIAKTVKERQAEFIERQEKQGLKMIRNLWAHPDDHAAIKQYVAKKVAARSKPPKK